MYKKQKPEAKVLRLEPLIKEPFMHQNVQDTKLSQ